MKTAVNNQGSSTAAALMIGAVVVIVGLTGWYVWQATATANQTLNEGSKTSSGETIAKTKKPLAATTTYTFPVEKMTVAYGRKWTVADSSHTPNSCGPNDRLTLKDNNLYLNFAFGSICGKGSAPCFQEPGSGCRTESKSLASVQLTGTDRAYVLVYRTTNDNGHTWAYAVGLTSGSACTTDFCSYTPLNLGSSAGGSTISAAYNQAAPNQTATDLDEFANLPEVQDAITVLKTARY